MKVKSIIEEDFVNYRKPSMFISACFCNWKCCHEGNFAESVCQNSPLASQPNKDIDNGIIYEHFVKNPITKAVVIGGLEPFMQFEEIYDLIKFFRDRKENSPFIIYTGYYPKEIKKEIEKLKNYKNIIIKFGRFIPNNKIHYDEILGVYLASDNQYALKIN